MRMEYQYFREPADDAEALNEEAKKGWVVKLALRSYLLLEREVAVEAGGVIPIKLPLEGWQGKK